MLPAGIAALDTHSVRKSRLLVPERRLLRDSNKSGIGGKAEAGDVCSKRRW